MVSVGTQIDERLFKVYELSLIQEQQHAMHTNQPASLNWFNTHVKNMVDDLRSPENEKRVKTLANHYNFFFPQFRSITATDEVKPIEVKMSVKIKPSNRYTCNRRDSVMRVQPKMEAVRFSLFSNNDVFDAYEALHGVLQAIHGNPEPYTQIVVVYVKLVRMTVVESDADRHVRLSVVDKNAAGCVRPSGVDIEVDNPAHYSVRYTIEYTKSYIPLTSNVNIVPCTE